MPQLSQPGARYRAPTLLHMPHAPQPGPRSQLRLSGVFLHAIALSSGGGGSSSVGATYHISYKGGCRMRPTTQIQYSR